ncbi:hypothetical protein HDU97_004698 [Phlyctochytrium planicorne]|nr:hypothetical protein HDU97_004698 [Phlyctochytrium planicorne]
MAYPGSTPQPSAGAPPQYEEPLPPQQPHQQPLASPNYPTDTKSSQPYQPPTGQASQTSQMPYYASPAVQPIPGTTYVVMDGGAATVPVVVVGYDACALGGGHVIRDNYFTIWAIVLSIVFIFIFPFNFLFFLCFKERICIRCAQKF